MFTLSSPDMNERKKSSRSGPWTKGETGVVDTNIVTGEVLDVVEQGLTVNTVQLFSTLQDRVFID